MKKKFGLWLNIVTICLCVCAIAIGVYSATQATLTVSGSIGFEAHGVEMTIAGNLTGYVSKANIDTATATESKDVSASITTATKTGAIDIGEVYFTDLILDENGNVPNIVLTLNFTNTSPFKVKATVSASSVLSNSDIEVTEDNAEVVMNANDGIGSVVITFKLQAQDTISALNLANKTIIVFEKVSEPKEGELYLDDGRLYVNYGYYPETEETVNIYTVPDSDDSSNTKMYGDNLGKPIRWLAIYDVNAKSASDLNTLTSVPKSGSYYFVSEYAFDHKLFNTVITQPVKNKNPNDYAASEIRDYLAEDGAFQQKYKLDKLFDDAEPRELPKEFVMYTMEGTDYSNGNYVIENCIDKLWLLDTTEVNYIKDVMGKSNTYYPSQEDQLYNQNPVDYGASLWLRTATSAEVTGVSILRYQGNITVGSNVNETYCDAIRAGFQLNIGS